MVTRQRTKGQEEVFIFFRLIRLRGIRIAVSLIASCLVFAPRGLTEIKKVLPSSQKTAQEMLEPLHFPCLFPLTLGTYFPHPTSPFVRGGNTDG